jgi:hypothetical protein
MSIKQKKELTKKEVLKENGLMPVGTTNTS